MFDDLTQTSCEQRLQSLEKTIERGLDAFTEVGKALVEIRDEKLYQPDYRTFEQYCAVKWGFDRSYAYRLMDSVQVVENLKTSPNGDILPANEAQTRPLVRLPAKQQREAWSKAVKIAPKGRAPTASQVRMAVTRMRTDLREIKRSQGWTTEDLKKDIELRDAFGSILSAYGESDTTAIRNGIIGLSRADVITLSRQPKDKLMEMQDLIMGHRWKPEQCLKFLAKRPDRHTTLEGLIFYCLGTKEKMIRVVLPGFEVTCKHIGVPRR